MPKTYAISQLLDAIRQVESSGRPHPPPGKNGELGPYQLTEAFWNDAWLPRYAKWYFQFTSGVMRDEMCRNTICKYWERYLPRAWPRILHQHEAVSLADCQKLARIVNGGPTGMRKKSTLAYWQKVKAELCKP